MAADDVAECLAMIGLYAGDGSGNASRVRRVVSVALFTAIYLGLWALTGVPIYLGSVGAQRRHSEALHTPAPGCPHRRRDLPGLADQAGVLRHCRSPLGLPLSDTGRGVQGGLADGAGACPVTVCGCCWALMRRFWRWSAQWGYPGVFLIRANRGRPRRLVPGALRGSRGLTGVCWSSWALAVAARSAVSRSRLLAAHPRL